jgi:hypothetical protein
VHLFRFRKSKVLGLNKCAEIDRQREESTLMAAIIGLLGAGTETNGLK